MDPDAPPLSRFPPALVLALSLFLFAINYPTEDGQEYYLALVLLPCLGVSLSLFGLIDPRIFWSLGPRHVEFPRHCRALAILSAVLGVAAFLAIEVFLFGAFS